jgi:hypothetical protein
MPAATPKLIIVKRGKLGTYELLTRWMRDVPGAQIIWDRRTGDDRRLQRAGAATECRVKERRRPQDAQANVLISSAADLWSVYWYLATQAGRRPSSQSEPSLG